MKLTSGNISEYTCPNCGQDDFALNVCSSRELQVSQISCRDCGYMFESKCSEEDLIDLYNKTMNLKKGTYRHYKGDFYQVVDFAKHTETGQAMVVYRALYGDNVLYVRPLTMFTEHAIIDGVKQLRFAYTY